MRDDQLTRRSVCPCPPSRSPSSGQELIHIRPSRATPDNHSPIAYCPSGYKNQTKSSNLMSDIDNKDVGVSEHIERVESTEITKDFLQDRELAVKIPASLVGLSQSEISAIDRRTTRKLDILLVPTLLWLYVLNYLGETRFSFQAS